MENNENQQKLMELFVDKVLQKHGVIKQKPSLDQKEKERIAEIVKNIKVDVETFLDNMTNSKTEMDFPETNVTQVVESPIKNQRTFTDDNNLNSVKNFLRKRN